MTFAQQDGTLRHLPDHFGHGRTVAERRPVWGDGSPIPWMTYPAISYLDQLDFSDRQVFEYGAGNSTLFWAARARHVISVENDPEWAATIGRARPKNVELFHLAGADYVSKVTYGAPHDVIIIDGRWRYDCAMMALPYLAEGGMIVLDNAERHPPITRHFREQGLIQVDMIGYGPQNDYIWCTSLFLSRSFATGPRHANQPPIVHGMIDSRPQHDEINRPGAMA